MTNKLLIKGEMTDLNFYINETRKSRYASADIKREETERVQFACFEQRLGRFSDKVNIAIKIFAKDRKKDEDNYFIYAKWLLDGLKAARVIKNDGMKDVHITQLEVFIDTVRPRVEVEITPAV